MQTITHRVRTFLAREGVAVEPWTGLGETYGELYELLQQRRDDPSFWPPLEALLRAVIEHATDPDTTVRLAAPEAELLTSQDVDELVQALRDALPTTDAEATSLPLAAFTQQLSPAVLGGFLLFGFVAAGCGDPDPTEEAATTGGASGHPPATGGHSEETGGVFSTGGHTTGGTGGLANTGGTGGLADTGGTGGVADTGGAGGIAGTGGSSGVADTGGAGGAPETGGAGGFDTGGAGGNVAGAGGLNAGGAGGANGADGCQLPGAPTVAAAINAPDAPAYYQTTLCACLNAIDQSWTDGLAALFENASDSEIAAQLRQMVECCNTGDVYRGTYPGYIPYCMIAPAYKGVSFS